ncbi:MAG: deoxyribonuclease V [Deltaproteobacteria bacterium]|jgi:deoxyribonuclease V|nr:deoxyribonuclease V [Deltaproteobacteria bacterium]
MICFSHSWDISPEDARRLQMTLAAQIVRENHLGTVKAVAGVDVGIKGNIACAAIVVLNFPGLDVAGQSTAIRRITFPYIPGLLSFREGPVILDALDRLDCKPDLLIFDGQGIAHPCRLGIASHIGLLTDFPSIGCAKSRLCGQYQEPDVERGSYVPLLDNGGTIGAIVRTRTGVKPVFVSIGHRVDLKTSIDYVLGCCTGYRLPETTRKAHRLAAEWKSSH